jgi:peptide/nickel transport system substrate-binding protein
MKRKIAWLTLSCVIVLALILASCGPAVEEEEGKKTVVGKVTEEEAEEEEKEVIEEKIETIATTPRYGGTITIAAGIDVRTFDPKFVGDSETTMMWNNEKLAKGDWARGPAGTGEVEWILPGVWSMDYDAPMLAESWEWPDNETIVFHIRKGVHFQNKAPAFGREMTAEDVAYSIYRKLLDPESLNYPTKEEDRLKSVEAIDKWTVVVKTPTLVHGSAIQSILAECWIFPEELGDGDMTNWEDVIGTGPWVLKDYVIQSSLTFEKNPIYWLEDPVNPGNKLPYADFFRILVIEDPSTRISAIRTGKIDAYRGLTWDEGESLMRSNPELQYSRYLRHTAPMIWMRQDNEALPFSDLMVRRALSMALDRDAIIEGYYRGNAEKFCHPVMPTGELADIFVPLEEQSAETQERYEYHPDKAKQLLAEAGYPNGFKAEIVCYAPNVDVLSIVKQQWAEIDVDLELDVRESGAWRSIQRSQGYESMLWAQITGIYYTVPLCYLEDYPRFNRSVGYDQYVEDFYREKMLPYRGPIGDATLRKNFRELIPYLLDLCWAIELPSDYFYNFWQPWVGGYHGEYSTGRGWWNDWPMYVWIDQDVKYHYTGQRD